MPSPLYSKLLSTLAGYMGAEKARAALDRQLVRCQATPDTFAANHLREAFNYVIGSTTLYLPPAKQQELTDKVRPTRSGG